MLTFSPGPGRSKSKKAIKITWHFQVWALNQPGAAPPLINDCSQLWILGCCRTHISINTLCTLGTNILFDINLKTKLKSRSSDVIYGDPIVKWMQAKVLCFTFYPSLVRTSLKVQFLAFQVPFIAERRMPNMNSFFMQNTYLTLT